MKFELGQKVTDTATAFTGTVTGRWEQMSDAPQYYVEALRSDGGVSAGWYAEARLKAAE